MVLRFSYNGPPPPTAADCDCDDPHFVFENARSFRVGISIAATASRLADSTSILQSFYQYMKMALSNKHWQLVVAAAQCMALDTVVRNKNPPVNATLLAAEITNQHAVRDSVS